jgi:2-polyprenyl-3-methyl-5-hydroxy-6-metoxy-1,4-benzoquinol methylase
MHNRISLKDTIHRLAYSTSIVLPLPFLWDKLHNRDYHPKVDGIIQRINLQRQSASSSLFVRWGEQLNHHIDLRDKSVLEIGHGGGWYIAEVLDSGAANASGLEISDEINKRANYALKKLKYINFQLFRGNGKDLQVLRGSKYDIIFTITVLQHMPTRITKKYLKDISNLLAPDGICIIQTLNSYGSSMKRLSKADLFSVAYNKREFDKILVNCGLHIIGYAQEKYGSEQTYWGIYLVKISAN